MKFSKPYKSRPIRFVAYRQIESWRMKVYSIVYGDEKLSPRLTESALHEAGNLLQNITDQTGHYGVGFIGIHQGKNANFVFVDWWADENELHHVVFISDKKDPAQLKSQPAGGAIACVWDLYLVGFERDAWVNAVLKQPENPDIEKYMQTVLNTQI